MKKIFTTLAMSTLLVPSMATVSLMVNEENVKGELIIEDSGVEYFLEDVTLISESYNGESLIRYFQDDISGKESMRFIDLPTSITEKVDVNDEKAVAKVTALLAQYYAQDSINNIPSLNMILLSYVPDVPLSKVSISKEYRKEFSENLEYVLDILEENNKVEILEEERNLLEDFYDDKKVPFNSKEEVLKATESWYKELRIKWYEKTSTYIVIGVIFVLLSSAFIISKRR